MAPANYSDSGHHNMIYVMFNMSLCNQWCYIIQIIVQNDQKFIQLHRVRHLLVLQLGVYVMYNFTAVWMSWAITLYHGVDNL